VFIDYLTTISTHVNVWSPSVA